MFAERGWFVPPTFTSTLTVPLATIVPCQLEVWVPERLTVAPPLVNFQLE
jgi:hypothetical protein